MHDIKRKLKSIFQFYTSFGDRFNSKFLKSNKFHKMMNDSNIRDNTLTQKRLDLLFCKVNKHQCNMSFDTFCNLLPLIAKEKYPQMLSEESSMIMIQEHMLPLYENIYNETEVGFDDMLFR